MAANATGASLPIVYTGDPWGLAAVAFSLATNTFSTSLIGYKAWYVALPRVLPPNPHLIGGPFGHCREHRSFLRAHLGTRRSTTTVVRMLALLVESGVAYCLIWVRPQNPRFDPEIDLSAVTYT